MNAILIAKEEAALNSILSRVLAGKAFRAFNAWKGFLFERISKREKLRLKLDFFKSKLDFFKSKLLMEAMQGWTAKTMESARLKQKVAQVFILAVPSETDNSRMILRLHAVAKNWKRHKGLH